MDRNEQTRVRGLLEATLEDGRLSNEERASVEAVVEGLAHDRTALGFLRNEAFRLARARVEADPTGVVAWLDRVDKLVDHALKAPGGGGGGDEIAFSPGEACLRLLRGCLGGARRTVDVCVFTITDDRITATLLERAKRGVTVRVVTDDEKAWDPGSDIARLRDAGIAVRTDDSPAHMHHKFAVVDGRLLVNGSYNWTRGAVENHENVHATTDPKVVEAFAGHFGVLWDRLGRR